MSNIQLYNDDCIDILRQLTDNSIDTIITDPPAGISFMNKKWDDNKGGRDNWINWLSDIMKECLRVTKPGGMLICWAIPRTSHWTGMAIENAGWEVRDVITHIFGTGFPKSLDIGKQIDAKIGPNRVVVDTIKVNDMRGGNYKNYSKQEEGALWEGYGTALKPACEFYWLAYKPTEGTYAENALKHGVAGLNINGARIETDDKLGGGMVSMGRPKVSDGWDRPWMHDAETTEKKKIESANRVSLAEKKGRWPANLILDEESAKLLDKQSGENNASRFFYCAKASTKEREEGLLNSDAEDKSGGVLGFRQDGSLDGTVTKKRKNIHPTVKPVALMRYLCRLTSTPTNGIVLDPFMGSGTTGIAAKLEDRDFIGIEKEVEYFEIAKNRIYNYLEYRDGDNQLSSTNDKNEFKQGLLMEEFE